MSVCEQGSAARSTTKDTERRKRRGTQKIRVTLMPELQAAVIDIARRFAPQCVEISVADVRADAARALLIVSESDFLMGFPRGMTADVLRAARGRVRLIQLLGAGYDPLDIRLADEYGLPVASNGGANANAVAEHTILLILALYRDLVELANFVRDGGWQQSQQSLLSSRQGYHIEGKIVGLVGMGYAGRAVATRLKAFGARLIYNDIHHLSRQAEKRLGLTSFAELDVVCSQSEIISLHVPLLDETRNLIDSRRLSLMKRSAVLINTARGGIVDEVALVEALREKRIAGAALDTLSKEPPPRDHPILTLENCIVTPHCAGPTWDSWPRRFINGFTNISRVWHGRRPQWLVSVPPKSV